MSDIIIPFPAVDALYSAIDLCSILQRTVPACAEIPVGMCHPRRISISNIETSDEMAHAAIHVEFWFSQKFYVNIRTAGYDASPYGNTYWKPFGLRVRWDSSEVVLNADQLKLGRIQDNIDYLKECQSHSDSDPNLEVIRDLETSMKDLLDTVIVSRR